MDQFLSEIEEFRLKMKKKFESDFLEKKIISDNPSNLMKYIADNFELIFFCYYCFKKEKDTNQFFVDLKFENNFEIEMLIPRTSIAFLLNSRDSINVQKQLDSNCDKMIISIPELNKSKIIERNRRFELNDRFQNLHVIKPLIENTDSFANRPKSEYFMTQIIKLRFKKDKRFSKLFQKFIYYEGLTRPLSSFETVCLDRKKKKKKARKRL